MRQMALRWGLVLLVTGVLSAGCVSFDSVKQTAALGSQISSQESVFDPGPAFCRIANVKPAPDPLCDMLQKDLDNWHRVNRALVGYSKALNAMADDSKDKSYKDGVSTMLGAVSSVPAWSTYLNSNVTSGVSAGVDGLIQTITTTYRRAELKQAIEKNDDHIQNIAAAFDVQIRALDDADRNIQETIETAQSTITPGRSPEGDAMRIADLHLLMAIGDHRLQLANCKKAVDGFAKAHHDLKEHISSVGVPKGDIEVVQVIAKDMSAILAGGKALAPPAK